MGVLFGLIYIYGVRILRYLETSHSISLTLSFVIALSFFRPVPFSFLLTHFSLYTHRSRLMPFLLHFLRWKDEDRRMLPSSPICFVLLICAMMWWNKERLNTVTLTCDPFFTLPLHYPRHDLPHIQIYTNTCNLSVQTWQNVSRILRTSKDLVD